jgi:hypothetical protein
MAYSVCGRDTGDRLGTQVARKVEHSRQAAPLPEAIRPSTAGHAEAQAP